MVSEYRQSFSTMHLSKYIILKFLQLFSCKSPQLFESSSRTDLQTDYTLRVKGCFINLPQLLQYFYKAN